jgi:putative FmdB family regulatory protein
MPLYEYECDACGRRFEVIQKFSDAPPGTCAQCGKGPVRRLLSSPAIQFKGSGWYINDYAKKSGSVDSSTSNSGEKKTEKSESKSESSSDTSSTKSSSDSSSTPATKGD